MASSTKWRLNVTANNGGDLLGIAELQFRTTVGSPLTFTDYDAVDASTGIGSSVNAMDGIDTNDWYSTYPANTGWWEYTYEEAVEIKSYAIQATYPDGATVTYAPKDWTLEYWDGADWVVADTKTDIEDWTSHETREFVVGSGVNAYTPRRGMYYEASDSWRLNITAVNGGTQIKINRIQMRKVVGTSFPAWDTVPYASASASSEATTNNSDNAVANTSSNYWITVDGVTSAYIQLDYDWPISVRQYQFYAFDAGSAPMDFTLEYWNGTAWVVADSRSGVSGSPQTYTITPLLSETNDGDITLPLLTLYGSESYPPDIALPQLTLSGSMLQAAVYTGAVNLGNPNNLVGFDATPYTLSASALGSGAYNGAVVLPLHTIDASLEGPLPLPALTLDASGFVGNLGDGLVTLPDYTLAGGFEDARRLPLLTLDATAINGNVADGDVALDGMTLAGGLDAPLELPALTLDARLDNGSVATAQCTLPSLDADGTVVPDSGGTLPLFSLDAAGLAGMTATGNVTLPKFTSAASQYQDTSADGAITLPRATVAGSVVSDNLIDGAVTLGRWQLLADGVTGQIAGATITIPLLTVSASGFSDATGEASITFPFWQLDASAFGTDDPLLPTAPTVTLAINTRTKAVTTHTNMAFNSFATFNGVELAASDNGIYALMGDDDAGTPIDALLRGGVTDMDSEQLKRVLGGYVGYRADGGMDLTLFTDQHHEYVYRLEPRQDGSDLHPTRVKTGRGVDGRYWQWQLENRDGQPFELDSLALDADVLKRRV